MSESYGDILEFLKTLTLEQLAQRPMVMLHHPDTSHVAKLLPVVMLGTAEEMGRPTRGAWDGKHHPEQIVISTDYHPFDNDGNMAYELVEKNGQMFHCGDATGKLYTDEDLQEMRDE